MSAVLSAASTALAGPRRAVLLVAVGIVLAAALLATWWPGGVALGAVVGAAAVFGIGRRMSASAPVDEDLAAALGVRAVEDPAVVEAPVEPAAEPAAAPAPVASVAPAPAPRRPAPALAALDPELARAARLVIGTQYASAARLQRELHLPYARARRLLDALETEHVVGPASGTRPRRVLLAADRLPELEQRLTGAPAHP